MHEINERWLKDNGFIKETWSKNLDFTIVIWTDETHRIEFKQGHTNRNNCKYAVHIDNSDMQSIGSADLIYVEEFIKFLECLGEYQLAQNFNYKTE